MKRLIPLLLASLLSLPLHAELFGPNGAATGALLGGLAGGIIGYNNHNQTGRGIAIGAASGLILGSMADQASTSQYRGTQVGVPYYSSYYPGRSFYGYSGYYSPGYYSDYSDYSYERPNYATNGLLLGGLAGAIIGNNSGSHNGWRGAAIGAGTGLILGSIAENNVRERETAEARGATTAPATQAAPATSAPQQVTIINNYYNTPATAMSGANSLFGRN